MSVKANIYTSTHDQDLGEVWISTAESDRILMTFGTSMISMTATSARAFGQMLVTKADEAEARAIGRLSKDEE